MPIILWKNIKDLDNNSAGFYSMEKLSVTNQAELPKNTFIGDINTYTALKQIPILSNTVEKVETLINKSITIRCDATAVYICLHNFTENDVGLKIFLYRTNRRRKSKKGYSHPADPDRPIRSCKIWLRLCC